MILSQLDAKYQDIYIEADLDSAVIQYAKWYAIERISDVLKMDREKESYRGWVAEVNKVNTITNLLGFIRYSEYTDYTRLRLLPDEIVLFVVLKCQ